MPAAPPPLYDVIVAGMGPAGASTAYELRRAGLSVLGLDKQKHPRQKVCGGGLSARIAAFLPDDFPTVVEAAVHRMHFSYGPRETYTVASTDPMAYMVMRSRFDHWLLSHAQHAGADVHDGEAVTRVELSHEHVAVSTTHGLYHSRVLVGADGATGLVAQQVFGPRRLRMIPALESEVPVSPACTDFATDAALISLNAAKKGYGWIFPKDGGLSIGVGEFVRGMARPKRSFAQFIQDEPVLARCHIAPPLGHPIPVFNRSPGLTGRRWNDGLVKGRALLVGDAGHLVDPLLGEGIFYAVRSGQLAAASIATALRAPDVDLSSYESAIIQEFGHEFQIAARLGRLIYGVPRSWHRWIGRTLPSAYQGVLRRYCGILQGTETYRTLWNRIVARTRYPMRMSPS